MRICSLFESILFLFWYKIWRMEFLNVILVGVEIWIKLVLLKLHRVNLFFRSVVFSKLVYNKNKVSELLKNNNDEWKFVKISMENFIIINLFGSKSILIFVYLYIVTYLLTNSVSDECCRAQVVWLIDRCTAWKYVPFFFLLTSIWLCR